MKRRIGTLNVLTGKVTPVYAGAVTGRMTGSGPPISEQMPKSDTTKWFDSAEQTRLIKQSLAKFNGEGWFTLESLLEIQAIAIIERDPDFEGCRPEDLYEGIKSWMRDQLAP